MYSLILHFLWNDQIFFSSEAKKQRRKEKILLDLQEKAFWRVHRPPVIRIVTHSDNRSISLCQSI